MEILEVIYWIYPEILVFQISIYPPVSSDTQNYLYNEHQSLF